MLRALAIRDFVIAERVEIELDAGFSVLTGETGAGKSILIDALELLVGGRTSVAVVREGAERAELSAEFEIPERGLLPAWLEAQDMRGDPGTLLLRRSIDRASRSRCFINGRPATLAQLREAGEGLLDIHGQHEHQSLLRPSAQRELLDVQAGCTELVAEMAQAWREWNRLEALAVDFRSEQRDRQLERSELLERLAELERLAPGDQEWKVLAARHSQLAHGSSLLAGSQAALEGLSEGDAACLTQLSAIESRLRELAGHDPGLVAVVELVESAQAQAGEAARALRQYASRVDLDPAALREVEARIGEWHGAARRLRVRPEELPVRMQEMQARLRELDLTRDPEALEREVRAAAERARAVGARVSSARRVGAQALSRAVTQAMQSLSLAGARFNVGLRPLETLQLSGAESVEFEVATHASLPLRPLAKVASGGELSRISLAIQLLAAKSSPVGTLIFDEVDTGIGGAVASTVGQALRRLGQDRQVLCVTHLAQVASQADAQWAIAKGGGRRPRVSATRLGPEHRVEEIARMLGGAEITATTRRHAAEMLTKVVR